jgi:hypothetical protein
MDPQRVNPTQAGYTLANVAELLLPCLDAAGARTVLEVGAFRGELTLELLDWAAGSGARITAIDPEPPDELLELATARPELELLRKVSHDVLAERPLADAIVLDGDHNHFTLSGELRLIAERAADGLPLLLFHDVGWPHARRDSYYAPDRVPEDKRQEIAHNAAVAPGETGVVEDGLPFEWVAATEGGAGNGVLTAIEDFMASHPGLVLVRVPAFFGFGVLYPEDAAYAGALGDLLAPFDQNPVLDRLEANRVAHLVQGYGWFRRHEEMRRRVEIQEELLWRIAGSRALDIAEQVSRVRNRGEPAFTRRQIEQALAREDD